MISLEELQIACLGACRAFRSPAAQPPDPMMDLTKVLEEVLRPEAGALADRGQLRRLEMRVGVGRDSACATGEVGERSQHRHESPAEDLERLPGQQGVRIVGDEGAGRSEVDDPSGVADDLGVVAQMCDDVVSCFALDLSYPLEVDLVRVSTQCSELRLVDR